jgi:hypothetical protein
VELATHQIDFFMRKMLQVCIHGIVANTVYKFDCVPSLFEFAFLFVFVLSCVGRIPYLVHTSTGRCLIRSFPS